jgi:type IV pilus assembly protein PilE
MGSMKKAFTLMEMMVVVTIVGIIAGFAIPNYATSVERSYRRDAENNLRLISAAQRLYAARNNDLYWGAGNLTVINSNLGLNIISNGITYNCAGGGATYTCTATRNGGWVFTVTITEALANPTCAGNCP